MSDCVIGNGVITLLPTDVEQVCVSVLNVLSSRSLTLSPFCVIVCVWGGQRKGTRPYRDCGDGGYSKHCWSHRLWICGMNVTASNSLNSSYQLSNYVNEELKARDKYPPNSVCVTVGPGLVLFLLSALIKNDNLLVKINHCGSILNQTLSE